MTAAGGASGVSEEYGFHKKKLRRPHRCRRVVNKPMYMTPPAGVMAAALGFLSK